MKIQTLLLAALFSAAGFSGLAQSNTPVQGADAEQNLNYLGRNSNDPGGIVRVYDNRYEGMKGTPFYWKGWGKAAINGNKAVYEGVQVKYNVLENNLLYLNAKGEPMVLEAHQITGFVLTDSLSRAEVSFRKEPALANLDPQLSNKFAEVVFEQDGKALLAVHRKEILKANYQGAYSANRTADELLDKPQYFYVSNGKVQELKLSKRTFYDLFPEKQEELKKFVKTNYVDLNESGGWAKALRYYNEQL